MDSAGSRTQLPSIVLAVDTLLLLLFGTALLADIPSPAVGAIVDRLGRELARNPSWKNANSRNMPPHTMGCARASVA